MEALRTRNKILQEINDGRALKEARLKLVAKSEKKCAPKSGSKSVPESKCRAKLQLGSKNALEQSAATKENHKKMAERSQHRRNCPRWRRKLRRVGWIPKRGPSVAKCPVPPRDQLLSMTKSHRRHRRHHQSDADWCQHPRRTLRLWTAFSARRQRERRVWPLLLQTHSIPRKLLKYSSGECGEQLPASGRTCQACPCPLEDLLSPFQYIFGDFSMKIELAREK